jgi:hypothetical protein
MKLFPQSDLLRYQGASHQSSAHLANQFQRRRLLEIGQSETRIVCGDHVCQRIGMKCAIFID